MHTDTDRLTWLVTHADADTFLRLPRDVDDAREFIDERMPPHVDSQAKENGARTAHNDDG
jgi:hypothetical protein